MKKNIFNKSKTRATASKVSTTAADDTQNNLAQNGITTNIATHFSKGNSQGQVLLATALVRAESKKGPSQVLRGLLDQGSQASFITEVAAQLLGVKKIASKSAISGIGGGHGGITSRYLMLLSSKRLCRTQKQILGILFVVFISVITFFITMDKAKIIIEDLRDTNRLVQKRLKENVEQEKGTGCIMPELDPFSEEIMNFTEYIPKVICDGTDWVDCYKSECYVVKEILKNMRNIVCTYTDIIYVNDQSQYLGNPIKLLGDEKYTLNKSDHVKIDCTAMDVNSLGILSSRWSGFKAGFRPVPTKPIPPKHQNSYNVMILGFDSTSRNGFIRKMRKSHKYLDEKLKAVILNSYNIVGDGNTGALYPILTGKAEEEHFDSRRNAPTIKYVDETQFIFHLLKEYGYRTAYFENMPWRGTFQYKFNGFRHQPADHYLRALLMEEADKGDKWYKGYPSRHCIGAVPQHELMMNLTDQFLQLDGKKFVFTMIMDISYDNFNMLATADEALLSFLQGLDARGALEDTLVLVMGDHGSRFANIRDTYQGKLEERLPLMAILLPEKLKELRPNALKALKHNQNVLTTPFDIHTTLLDVLELKDKSNKHKIPGSDLPRAISLLEPIPKSRSCGEAGVMPHWCACTRWINVSRSEPIYSQVANILAEYIDKISHEQRLKCAKRDLLSVEWVLHQKAKDQLLKYGYMNIKETDRFLGNTNKAAPRVLDEYYQAKIVMSPGVAIFEGTLIYNTGYDYFVVTQRDISRINPYGDESQCISATHPHLLKYCFCRNKLVRTSARNVSTTMY